MTRTRNHGKKRRLAIAPKSGKELRSLIKQRSQMSLRGIARILSMDPAAVHRLCTTGAGSEDNICTILKYLELKPRRIREFLAARRAELSEGDAKEIWKDFCYAFPNDREYMEELCPFPLEQVCACTRAGIPLQYILDLAQKEGIRHVEDLTKIKAPDAVKLYHALSTAYKSADVTMAFSQKVPKNIPLVAHLDVFEQHNAAERAILHGCTGTSLFGIPHVVLTHYVFQANGKVERHTHVGGVEFIYSEEGAFELECKSFRYPRLLEEDGSVIVLHGRTYHSIRLAKGQYGRLLVVRYDPRRRYLPPGPTLQEREDRKRERREKRQHVNIEGRPPERR